ncbi:hypothetical protein Efla_003949 [Eimeria flavescens]
MKVLLVRNEEEDGEAGLSEFCRKFTPISPLNRECGDEIPVKVYLKDREEFADGLNSSAASSSKGKCKSARTVRVRQPQQQIIDEALASSFLTVLENKGDETKFFLIYPNKTEGDILLRTVWSAEQQHCCVHLGRRVKGKESSCLRRNALTNLLSSLQILKRLLMHTLNDSQLWFTIDTPPADWKCSVGHVTKDMIKEHLPTPGPGVVAFCRGSKPMVRDACRANLDDLGYDPDDVATL